MGKGFDIEIEEQPSKISTKDVSKVQKRANLIKKPASIALKNRKSDMDIETGKDKIMKKIRKSINTSIRSRPTKKTGGLTQVTAKPEYKPETFKEFEKLYDASIVNAQNSKNLSRGQKRRSLRKEKLSKKHVIR